MGNEEMNKHTTTINLELLILNDLLSTSVIDRDLYERAIKRIINMNNTPYTGADAELPVSA